MAGLCDNKYPKNENIAVSPNDSSDVDRLDDYQDAPFLGGRLALNQESELTSPNPVDANHVETSCLVSNRTSTEVSPNANEQPAAARITARQCTRGMSIEETKEYFAVRDGAIEKAAEQCNPVLLQHLDGELRGVWLLTQIDHWDTEKERLLFLTDFSLIILKYDFITLKLLDYQRLHLKSFDKVQVGPLTYPEKSIMPPRNQDGIRCIWDNNATIPFVKEWNPWCRDIPWVTFTAHHLWDTPSPSDYYDVHCFSDSLVAAVIQLDLAVAPPTDIVRTHHCVVAQEPVLIRSYAGVAAAFHNANNLGFFKARGKVSF
ncbi:tumor protein p63-regulated gene 1-like protein isoform X1 [Ornithodoros turicata]|uniref:tumor protein p63-regulated gene 1-like protein isoform X1 n=1 Tax=Ornithodoros turicata TaxID=34597 RepID=UPI0031391FB6